MKTYWGRGGGIAPPFLTSALMEASGQIHTSAALTSGEGAPDMSWIGGWAGPRDGLNPVK
jgi:hypothetical protein